MTDLWQRLKQRKLLQWASAYVAAAQRDRSPVQPGQPRVQRCDSPLVGIAV